MRRRDKKHKLRKQWAKLTVQDIEEELKKLKFPGVEHYEWEEDGKRYSSWRFTAGGMIINTGDGGAKMILDEFKKQPDENRI